MKRFKAIDSRRGAAALLPLAVSVATSNKEPDMTPHIPENFWLVDWSLATIMGNAMPPRDPNDDDDDDEDEEDEEDENDEPAVIREPDEE